MKITCIILLIYQCGGGIVGKVKKKDARAICYRIFYNLPFCTSFSVEDSRILLNSHNFPSFCNFMLIMLSFFCNFMLIFLPLFYNFVKFAIVVQEHLLLPFIVLGFLQLFHSFLVVITDQSVGT